MTITILFIHEGTLIKLVVAYIPALDKANVEGFWDKEQNKIGMSWRMFSEFKNERDTRKRKAMIASLQTIEADDTAIE